jgi:hypothetical protein
MNASFPQFPAYACTGDAIKWTAQGFDLTATLEQDTDTKPADCECYDEADIRRWKNDDWFYVGVVVSVSFNGVELSDHAASLWGIDCNFNDTSNAYLSEVAQELQDEAIKEAKTQAARIRAALQEVPA